MKLALSWLREYVDVPVEPARLGDDLSLIGFGLDGLEKHEGDAVLDLDVTTNRVDCMNVYGLAREVAVLYGRPLRSLAVDLQESGPPAERALQVEIEAPELCPRFCARVLDVRLSPSPAWLRERLEKVGVRPINNVVDLTNYVMMEIGHPSHAFDLAKVPSGRLRIRWAREGERLVTLDGVERALRPGIGVVAGPEAPLALAGIMGGASSEVSDETRTVALEAAWWDPLSIRRGAKALGMHTEASHRFERGADPEAPPVATARIGHLLQRIGAGSVRPGLIDRHPAPRPRRTALLRPARTAAVLGAPVPEADAHRILRGLGFTAAQAADGGTPFVVPSWRGDVAREVDLIEEVGRHWGLNRVPSTVPPAHGAEGLRPHQKRERAAREVLVGAGFREVMTYSFVSDAAAGPWSAPRVALDNPLSEEQGVLRSSLVVPGLLQVLRTNLRQGRRDVRVFELGRVFAPGPSEQRRLGLLHAGSGEPSHWSAAKGRAADFFDLKGVVERLSERLDAGSAEVQAAGELPPFLHPGQAALVTIGGEACGAIGALHPALADAWELRGAVLVGELRLDPLLQHGAAAVQYRPLARTPAVERDVSVVVAEGLSAAELLARVRGAGGELLREALVADRYQGPPVAAGRVSLTLRLHFQDPSRTLTGDEVQEAMGRVVTALHGVGAEVRGE